ncbi:MAG: hypothetical protein ACK51T_11320, partial [bacterium]
LERDLQSLAADASPTTDVTGKLAHAHGRITNSRQRLGEVEARLAEMDATAISRDEARKALKEFDGVWANLSPREQARVLKLIFTTIEYDADAATVAVTFRPTGIAALCRGKLQEVA